MVAAHAQLCMKTDFFTNSLRTASPNGSNSLESRPYRKVCGVLNFLTTRLLVEKIGKKSPPKSWTNAQARGVNPLLGGVLVTKARSGGGSSPTHGFRLSPGHLVAKSERPYTQFPLPQEI